MMLGWGRKREGFEWREYVRTTILLKRKKRRDRVAAARDAAAEGLMQAGRKGADVGAAAARATGSGLRHSAGRLGHGLVALARTGLAGLGQGWSALLALLGWLAGATRRATSAAMSAAAAGLGFLVSGFASGVALLKVPGSRTRSRADPMEAPFTHSARASGSGWKQLAAGALRLLLAPASLLATGFRELAEQAGSRQFVPILNLVGAGCLGAGLMRLVTGAPDAVAFALAFAGIGLMLAFSGIWSNLSGRMSRAADVIGDNIDRMETRRLRYASAVGGALASTVVAGLIGAAAYAAAAPLTSHVAGLIGQEGEGHGGNARSKAVTRSASADASPSWSPAWPSWPAVMSLPEMPDIARLSSLNPFASSGEVVTGRARAMSGDTIRIGQRIIRLNGVEAPEYRQTCSRPGARRWRCGVSAERALKSLVRRTDVSCRIAGRDEAGFDVADCSARGRDISAELVRDGHVFAQRGFFAPYTALEDEARENGRGIWRGKAQRPAEAREAGWRPFRSL
jgi:endonuclease YncB( thermonuclease family)